ncbi:MAG: FAD-binding oxidoreductase [Flavobacteriaceae bacterium]|nr:FAD-binding oxidoreductase [Flavobacteriaceae bacterium]
MTKKVDYIVVGLGIAGVSLCEQLWRTNKTFVVIHHNLNVATHVAGGIINPVILKWFTPVWQVTLFLEAAIPFYRTIEDLLSESFLTETNILRIFNSAEEQNMWMAASDKNELSKYLEPKIFSDNHENLKTNFGFGKVNSAFQIKIAALLSAYENYLRKKEVVLKESFDFQRLTFEEDQIHYKNYSANKIVFAEGAAAVHNPYFPKDFLNQKKGEYITVKVPYLNLESILKGKYYVIPLGENLYKVGATFNHHDRSLNPMFEGKEELVEVLKKMILVPFEVVNQEAGLRPTVPDRRPLIGNLPSRELVYFFNGLGTHGLLMAPLLARQLFNYMEYSEELPSEINIRRFIS